MRQDNSSSNTAVRTEVESNESINRSKREINSVLIFVGRAPALL